MIRYLRHNDSTIKFVCPDWIIHITYITLLTQRQRLIWLFLSKHKSRSHQGFWRNISVIKPTKQKVFLYLVRPVGKNLLFLEIFFTSLCDKSARSLLIKTSWKSFFLVIFIFQGSLRLEAFLITSNGVYNSTIQITFWKNMFTIEQYSLSQSAILYNNLSFGQLIGFIKHGNEFRLFFQTICLWFFPPE